MDSKHKLKVTSKGESKSAEADDGTKRLVTDSEVAENVKPMPFREKRKLIYDIKKLPPDKLYTVVEFMRHDLLAAEVKGDEVILDLNEAKPFTLRQLQSFVAASFRPTRRLPQRKRKIGETSTTESQTESEKSESMSDEEEGEGEGEGGEGEGEEKEAEKVEKVPAQRRSIRLILKQLLAEEQKKKAEESRSPSPISEEGSLYSPSSSSYSSCSS